MADRAGKLPKKERRSKAKESPAETAKAKGKGKGKQKAKAAKEKLKAKPAKPAKAPPESAPPPNRPPEATAPPPQPRPQAAAAEPLDPLALLAPDQREALETLSKNLARAAMTAQGAMAEAALRQADRPAALSPDPFKVGPAMAEVISGLAAQPDKLVRAQADLFDRYMELWRTTAARAAGEPVEPAAEPARGDRRFADPAWRDPMFDVMKQSYLLTSNWLNELVSGVEGVDPMTKRRIEFFTRMLTDAFSPSNFLLSNPVALREAMKTQGESLVRGAENFAADLERGNGQLAVSQTDVDRFKVGENVATAPGKVVFQNRLFQLLQFSPTTPTVFETPILILPPWINKFYILDLRPENSMIRWLSSQGFTVFVASWVNPDAELAEMTLEDYMREGAYAAVEQTLKQAGTSETHTVGYCIGGTLLACTLAHMAAKKDRRVASATFFAAQQDFEEAGDLLLFTNEEWLGELEQKMDAAGGVLPGRAMADTFNSLRANDLVWSFFVPTT